MTLNDWENGRRIEDDLREIQEMFFAIDTPSDMTNLELMELQSKRDKNKINQAR